MERLLVSEETTVVLVFRGDNLVEMGVQCKHRVESETEPELAAGYGPKMGVFPIVDPPAQIRSYFTPARLNALRNRGRKVAAQAFHAEIEAVRPGRGNSLNLDAVEE